MLNSNKLSFSFYLKLYALTLTLIKIQVSHMPPNSPREEGELSDSDIEAEATQPLPLTREKTSDYAVCVVCKKAMEADTPEWKTMCEECFLARPRRPCKDCGESVIGEDEPDWRDRCRRCFDVYRETCRPCSVCGEPKIASTAPKWKNMCGSCYHTDREQNWTTCPTCVGDRAGKRNVRKSSASPFCHQCRVEKLKGASPPKTEKKYPRSRRNRSARKAPYPTKKA